MHPLYRKADALSQVGIGSAIEVHRLKGPGLMEIQTFFQRLRHDAKLLQWFEPFHHKFRGRRERIPVARSELARKQAKQSKSRNGKRRRSQISSATRRRRCIMADCG